MKAFVIILCPDSAAIEYLLAVITFDKDVSVDLADFTALIAAVKIHGDAP